MTSLPARPASTGPDAQTPDLSGAEDDPTATRVGGCGLAEERSHWHVAQQISQLLFATRGPDRVAQRAVSSLGLLSEVLWADVDSTPSPDPATLQIQLGRDETPRLRVRLVDGAGEAARETVLGLLQTVHGIYTREEEIERLRADAQTDPLTGLWNRRGFEPLARAALSRAARTGEEISLLLCDVDHFKQVNDTLGHQVGDQALRAIAEAIEGVIRPSDVAARVGGDEIALLLAGCSAKDATIVAARLTERLQSIRLGGPAHPRAVSVSIGIADTHVINGDLLEDRARLFRAADEALYRAKKSGRGTWTVHPSCFAPADVIDDELTEPIMVPAA